MNVCVSRCGAILAAVLLSLAGTLSGTATERSSAAVPHRPLVILNWSDYIDPQLVARFERRFDADVTQVYFESDDLRDTMMPETDSAGYDLVMVNGVSVESYRKRGWLAPLDAQRVPNNASIHYVVPAEGGNIWIDHLTVMAGSQRKPLAWSFIDFLNEPENAAQLAEYVHYPTPNRAAERLLPRAFLENPVIYPDAASLARSEAHAVLPPRATKARNIAFSRITQ